MYRRVASVRHLVFDKRQAPKSQKHTLGRARTWPYLPLVERQPLLDIRKICLPRTCTFYKSPLIDFLMPSGTSRGQNPPVFTRTRRPQTGGPGTTDGDRRRNSPRTACKSKSPGGGRGVKPQGSTVSGNLSADREQNICGHEQ